MKKFFTYFVLLCIVGAIIYYATHQTASGTITVLRTTLLQRSDLLSTVNATGTLQPQEVVNVGAQVAGLIVAFGEDPNTPAGHIDYCSVVEKDAVLARIDPTFHEAALEQAEAMLQSSQANLLQLETRQRLAENEWKRSETLFQTKTITDSEYDSAKSDYEITKANVEVGKATIRQNKAMVNTARINLGYCTIKSPVRGTIIERRVNIGQTVVASLNAPSLFLIAKDLSKMEVWTSVNEADIGRIKLNMPAWFTVDAHDGEIFRGTVTQIRMNAQMTQNVVTYTVVVSTDNSSGKLLPYLTANVRFEIEKREQVLLVPNVALRWSPDASQLDSSVSKSVLDETFSKEEGKGRIWIDVNGKVKPLVVVVGATDGTNTEISGAGLTEGLAIVIGEEERSADKDEETSNPFLPKFPRRPPPR